jgi:hypothetical protein
MHSDIEKDGDDARTVPVTPKVPVLPPVVEDKTPVVGETKKTEPVKKRKRYVMTIRTGANTEKAVFVLGDDDEDEGSTTTSKSDKEEKSKEVTKKPEEPKKPAPPAPLNPTPPSAFGKSMRTGRIQ